MAPVFDCVRGNMQRSNDSHTSARVIAPVCEMNDYLSGTLPFSHGLQTPVPVEQLEHCHQLLRTQTHSAVLQNMPIFLD